MLNAIVLGVSVRESEAAKRSAVRGRCEANLAVRGVVDGIEALEEEVPVDEVESLAGRGTEIGHDGIVRSFLSSELGIQALIKKLILSCELEGGAADVEHQALEVGDRVGGNHEKTRALIHSRPRDGTLILLERIRRNQHEGRAGVDDASRREDLLSAVRDCLVDSPIIRCGRSSGDGGVGNVGSELGRVDSAKGQLAVSRAGCRGRGVVDTDNLSGDRALREQVVCDGGHVGSAADGTGGKINWTDSNDAVDSLESLISGSDSN